jgi:hypothetical protein
VTARRRDAGGARIALAGPIQRRPIVNRARMSMMTLSHVMSGVAGKDNQSNRA